MKFWKNLIFHIGHCKFLIMVQCTISTQKLLSLAIYLWFLVILNLITYLMLQ